MIFKKNNKILDEDLFCNYIRSNKHNKLIKLIKKKKIDIGIFELNWNYISQYDELTNEFIDYFKNYINFTKLSLNKFLTTSHIIKFAHSLNWILLSQTYNFTINELHLFDKFIRWEYLFFYNNNPSNDLKIFFKQKMWWLFLDDNLSIDVSKKYHIYNNKILNKNIKEFPPQLVETFNIKLDEYKNNLNILKLILKKQLSKLYDEYENNDTIKTLKDINIECLYNEIRNDLNIKTQEVGIQNKIILKEISTQTEKQEISTQTEKQEIIEEIIDNKNYELIDSQEKEDSFKTIVSSLSYSDSSDSLKVQLEKENYNVSINLESDICGNN